MEIKCKKNKTNTGLSEEFKNLVKYCRNRGKIDNPQTHIYMIANLSGFVQTLQ